jgi:hypothetical protein
LNVALTLGWLRPVWWRQRPEVTFFASLHRADRGLAIIWWALLVALGVMPAVLALAMGALVGAVKDGESLALPLTAAGVEPPGQLQQAIRRPADDQHGVFGHSLHFGDRLVRSDDLDAATNLGLGHLGLSLRQADSRHRQACASRGIRERGQRFVDGSEQRVDGRVRV